MQAASHITNTISKFYLSFSLILLCFVSLAQTLEAADIFSSPTKGFRVRAEVVGNDTLPSVYLNEVEVCTEHIFRSQRQRELWTRTKFNVKKVYPYAILAAAKLKEYDKALASIPDEKKKKSFIKVCERDLRHEFEDEVKDLTISQGKVLMKLIDRETGKTTYDVVKQLRGSFQAAMWQTVARIFGHNMKVEYDANEEDLMIERAIKLVEEGRF
jgi:Domain of unknown function (DUF4294)